MVEDKFGSEKANYLKKSDYEKIEFKIDLLRQEVKTGMAGVKTLVAESKAEIKWEINKLIIWIIGIIFTSAMMFFALSKYIH